MSLSSNAVRVENESQQFASARREPAESAARPFTKDLPHHPAYRPDIDGLRALAIVPVVIFHAFPNLLPGGFIGVDVFFVISGFLISSIIFKGLQSETFSFASFYSNRIKRIFPALLLVLTASLIFGWFFLLPGEYAQLGKHMVGGAGYVENFILRREAGYFDTKSYLKPLMHLWSLAVEEQFYFTYPLLLWLLWRLRRNLLTIFVPLILISFALNIWLIHNDAVGAFFLPQGRFWELWVGGVLAYLNIFGPHVSKPERGLRWFRRWVALASRLSAPDEKRKGPPVFRNILSTIGLSLIAAAVALVHENSFPGWWALLPVIGAALLICGGPSAWINRKVLACKTAVMIGLISYPLYLWHWPILTFGRIVRGYELPNGMKVTAIALSVALSWFTWRFIESPIRFGRKLWIKTAALALISVATICVGYTIHREDGFAGRFKNLPEDFGWAHPEPYSTPECRKAVGSSEMSYCRSPEKRTPDVLLLGDSHAASLYRGLAPAYAKLSLTLMNLGEAGCVPFYGTESYSRGMRQEKDCRPVVNRMLDFATSTSSVRTIILSLRGAMSMSGSDFGEDANGAPEEIFWSGATGNLSQAEMFEAAFRNTVSRLSANGRNVVLFIDWPELGFDPRSCLPRPVPLFSHPRPLCGVPRSQVDARNSAYRQVIFKLKKEISGLRVFDPFPYLCDSAACYAMTQGHLLYQDDNHLSAAGAVFLADKFLAEQPSHNP